MFVSPSEITEQFLFMDLVEHLHRCNYDTDLALRSLRGEPEGQRCINLRVPWTLHEKIVVDKLIRRCVHVYIGRLSFDGLNEGDSYHPPSVCLCIITQQAKHSRFAPHL